MAEPSTNTEGYWYIDGQVYFLKLAFEPSTLQFQNAFRDFVRAVEPLDNPVSLILDVSKLHITGGTWVNVLDARRQMRNLPLSQAFVVGQSQHRLMKLMMLKLFDQVAQEVVFHNTLEDLVGQAPSA
jgi:hypothetical protein